MGFHSLTEMRVQEHPDLTVSIDYTVYPEEEPNREIYALYGYWYPDGDQNSLTYFLSAIWGFNGIPLIRRKAMCRLTTSALPAGFCKDTS